MIEDFINSFKHLEEQHKKIDDNFKKLIKQSKEIEEHSKRILKRRQKLVKIIDKMK